MMTTNTKRRLPAEWEYEACVLLSWPHANSDWAYMLDRVRECYKNIAEALLSRGVNLIIAAPDTTDAREALKGVDVSKIVWVDVATNDTWTRDFGPICVEDNGKWKVLDFKFNGWGLKFAANYDNLVTRNLCERKVISGEYENHLGFVLEGGSIESDGNGTILTTAECLLSPNRNGEMSREEIEGRLKEYLGATTLLWLENGALEGDDTDSHVDTLARLAPNETIVYVGCQDDSDTHYEELLRLKEELQSLRTPLGLPYHLAELPMADAVYDDEGHRLPATYANFLVTPQAVFMPAYGNAMKDMTAAGILGAIFEKEVVSIDCRALIEQHGSLHCATMQIPRELLCI